MSQQTLKKYADLTVCAIGLFAFLYILIKYALRPLLPFLLSLALAFLWQPTALRLSDKWGGKPRLYRLIFSLLTLGVLVALTVVLTGRLFSGGVTFLTEYADRENLERFCAFTQNLFYEWGGELGEALWERAGDALLGSVGDMLSAFSRRLGDFAAALPRLLLFLPVLVLAAVYLALDYEKIKARILCVLPKKASDVLLSLVAATRETAFPYVRAYLILMGMTFVFIAVGLWILRVKYALLLALLIAALDILPVIGVGTVLIPWGIYQIFFGARGLGIGLLALYVLHEIFRQIVEPHVVGAGLGVGPLPSLLFLYVGFYLFGVPGLLLLPIFSVVLKTLAARREKPTNKKGTA